MDRAVSSGQRAFAVAYSMCGWNASRAAVLAGYSSRHPRQSGHQAMNSQRVSKAMENMANLFDRVMAWSGFSVPEFQAAYRPVLLETIGRLRRREI